MTKELSAQEYVDEVKRCLSKFEDIIIKDGECSYYKTCDECDAYDPEYKCIQVMVEHVLGNFGNW